MAKDVETGVRALEREFGRLVANHRRRLGWSQEKLADRAEISEGMVAERDRDRGYWCPVSDDHEDSKCPRS